MSGVFRPTFPAHFGGQLLAGDWRTVESAVGEPVNFGSAVQFPARGGLRMIPRTASQRIIGRMIAAARRFLRKPRLRGTAADRAIGRASRNIRSGDRQVAQTAVGFRSNEFREPYRQALYNKRYDKI